MKIHSIVINATLVGRALNFFRFFIKRRIGSRNEIVFLRWKKNLGKI